MTFDLKAAQAAQDTWSRRNFPDRNPDHALLGLMEELGELLEAVELSVETPHEYGLVRDMMIPLGRLAHVNLKRAQGIRKASTSYDRECDALDELQTAFTTYTQYAGYPPKDTEQLPLYEPNRDKEEDAIGDILVYLMDRCNRSGQDLAEIADRVLGEVLRRNWKANSATGAA